MTRLAAILLFWASAAFSQGSISLENAQATDTRSGVEMTLTLSDIKPYRVFTLDAPRRLVLDVEGVEVDPSETSDLAGADDVSQVRAGPLKPGWTRIIFDLAAPLDVTAAGMAREGDAAVLVITLAEVTADAFSASAGAPTDPGWDAIATFDPADARRLADSTDYVVVLDAAHGGRVSGDQVAGIKEADLALIMAEELRIRLNAIDGVTAVLTRSSDEFVPDADRFALAGEVDADLVLSFHADGSADAGVRVATYAARNAGIEGQGGGTASISAIDSNVQQVLGDLARAETLPAAERVADAVAAGFARGGIPVGRKIRVTVDLPILSQATYPGVAIILGGLGDAPTRAYLASAEGRNELAETIADTIRLLAR